MCEISSIIIQSDVKKRLVEKFYAPSESDELYDEKLDQWFNKNYQPLRHPDEYNFEEGYTPFGDE